jgi:hypothetical protein
MDVWDLTPAPISLARRYLGPVGEGASAQVVLAQDELRRGSPPVVLKVMRRHLAAAGQKVLPGIPLFKLQQAAAWNTSWLRLQLASMGSVDKTVPLLLR